MWTNYAQDRLLVVAKTYPECSKKYGCIVCTVGLTHSGEWRRLYPIPWSFFWKGNGNGFKQWDYSYYVQRGICECCGEFGSDIRTEYHHRRYVVKVNGQVRPIFGYERPQDIVVLCRDCHYSWHRDPYGEFWLDPEEKEHHFYWLDNKPALRIGEQLDEAAAREAA